MLLPGRLLGAPAQAARCARSCLRLRLAARMTQTDAAQQQAPPPAAAGAQQRSPPCATTTPLAVQIPPPKDFYGLGARVEHVLAPREGRLSVLVAEALQLPQVCTGRAGGTGWLRWGLPGSWERGSSSICHSAP